MAKFNSVGEAQNLLSLFTSGGTGFDLAGLERMLGRQSAAGLRSAVQGDASSFRRAGLGRSVAGAFSPGTRGIQFNESLMNALTGARNTNARLNIQNRSSFMPLIAQILQQKYKDANRPSFLSQLGGGLLGLGAQAFLPGIAGRVLGNPNQDLIDLLLGGQERV